ncbi:DUF4163 domain-containing protein [Pseudomonas putida]|uniref:HNH endonuclease n=1 Tax=Pseudomonas putida TaxID=303 RepID=UPI00125FA9E8|nr:HNH endonuclease [Pseudomonas putida]KAB5624083.1 DUF4163 domain-containing protein [Pseudomonas putida]
MGRPAISAELKRAVLVEAGHQCAVPTCRHPDTEIHHIEPWEKCKKHEYHNLIALCPNCHTRVHNGKIDRKSLRAYKDALASSIRNLGASAFNHPIVEIKRKIFTIDPQDPELYFDFEFPDFAQTDSLIASKNIERWGVELLDAHNEAVHSIKADPLPFMGARLKGRYSVMRRDEHILSLRYTIDSYYGGAHGSTETRVQNFTLSPFSPITLDELLINEQSLSSLSTIVRDALIEASSDRPIDWMMEGTLPHAENFSCFTIGLYTVDFVFREYQIDCFAAGTETLHVPFDRLKNIVKPEILDLLLGTNEASWPVPG